MIINRINDSCIKYISLHLINIYLVDTIKKNDLLKFNIQYLFQ